MNLATATLVYMIFITVEQLSGSFFKEKRGSCPMYKVNTGNSLCDQEESQCETDYDCIGHLKCCEGERCGVSKCIKPLTEVINPVRKLELCPVVQNPHGDWRCRQLETKFCYKMNCARCCTHTTNCNPAKGVLLPPDECRVVDLRPAITYDKNSGQSGESLRIRCEPKHSSSVVQWAKVAKGKLLTIPSSMTSRTTEHLILEIRNSTVGDTGNYSCRVVHDEKTYYREVSVTVRRSDNQDACVLPLQKGLCDGDMTRYYYDINDDSCKTFQFLGCKGNDNNFVTKGQCEERCKGRKLKCPTSGIPKYQNCPPTQQHDCHSNENCGYRKTCCLVGCSRKCIDPSKPWAVSVTTKSIQSTGQPATSAPSVPCGKLVCKHFAECQTNASGLKECVCPKACSFAAIHPICGKDVSTGRRITYPSMCFLKIRSCRLQRPVVLVRLGRCATFGRQIKVPRDPCKVKQCSPYATCVINRFNGQPQCLCPRFCRFVPNRVCGSDGRTYHNECILKVLSCKKKLYVKIEHYGPCNRL